jgi:hypothetical protein
MARTLLPRQNSVGQTITTDGGWEDGGVVGVVSGVRHEALEKAGGSEMYLPMRQTIDRLVLARKEARVSPRYAEVPLV